MLKIPPTLPRRRRRNRAAPSAPPGAPLVLVTAIYATDGEAILYLYFDRDIDIASMDPTQFIVVDPDVLAVTLRGTSEFGQPEPNAVQIVLEGIGPAPGSITRLSVGPASGLIAADDGGTWPGVTDLELPFP